jgi:hypothetical protein
VLVHTERPTHNRAGASERLHWRPFAAMWQGCPLIRSRCRRTAVCSGPSGSSSWRFSLPGQAQGQASMARAARVRRRCQRPISRAGRTKSWYGYLTPFCSRSRSSHSHRAVMDLADRRLRSPRGRMATGLLASVTTIPLRPIKTLLPSFGCARAIRVIPPPRLPSRVP